MNRWNEYIHIKKKKKKNNNYTLLFYFFCEDIRGYKSNAY